MLQIKKYNNMVEELYILVKLYKIIIEGSRTYIMENERICQQLIPEIVEIYGDLLVIVDLEGGFHNE